MTPALIAVSRRQVGEATVQAVNARDLHAFLGIGRDFTNWVKDQVERARLLEHRDFEVFAEKGENPGGRPRIEYALTLDAAKHIAMMSGTEKGFEAREYFLECERLAQDPIHCLLTMSRPEMLEMAAGLAREKQALAARVQAQAEELAAVQPKVLFHDQVAATQDLQTVQEVAKTLGTGPTRFFAWLRARHVLFGPEALPYQEFQERGYFVVRTGTRIDEKGRDRAWSRTYFTGKGLIWIQKCWSGRGAPPEPPGTAFGMPVGTSS